MLATLPFGGRGGMLAEVSWSLAMHKAATGGRSSGAIRRGDWKLIEFFDTGKLELYNLAEDPGEQRNLAESMPEVARKLHQQLRLWRKSVGARGGQ